MSVLWTKVWLDLRNNRARSILAIFSITIGLIATGTIFGLVNQLLTAMDRAHQEVQPAHINIFLRNIVDQAVVDELKEIDGILDIDPVNQLSIQYRTSAQDDWKLGNLVMRDDYENQTYDWMILKQGDFPQDDLLGLERLTSQDIAVGLGDSVVIKAGTVEEEFEVNGLIRHPFVQPPLFGGQAHFFTDAVGLEKFGIPEGFYGQLLVQVNPYSLEFAQQVAGEIRSALSDQGYGVVITIYQDPNEHWGRMFVEGINLVLQIMAVVALVLSVILIMNIMTALITQQTDQIGVIKAIGGSRMAIIRTYLSSVVFYSLAALFISIPISLIAAYLSTQWFLNLFNIDYEVFQFSQFALILQIVLGLVVPVAAALQPILHGASISVREAFATYGIGADFGQSGLDRWVERISSRFFSSFYAAAFTNIFRRKLRLLLNLGVWVTAGVTFMVVMSLIASTVLTIEQDISRRNYDVRVGFRDSQPTREILDLTLAQTEVIAAAPWYSRNALLLRDGERLQDSAGLGAQLIGLPTTFSTFTPLISEGRWFMEGENSNVVVLSAETAQKNKIKIGDSITLDLGDLGSDTWEVIGLYRVIYGSGFLVEEIYTPLDALYQSIGQRDVLTQVLIQTNLDGLQQNTDFSESLKTLFEEEGYALDLYTTTITLQERQYAFNQYSSVLSILLGLAMLMATVGGIGLMGTLGISVVERRREIGVLRAIGAHNRAITNLLLLESLFQGLLSWVITIPLALLLSPPMTRLLGQTMVQVDLDYAFNGWAILIWLLIVVFVTIFASTTPARDAVRVSVRESLNYN